MSSSLVGSIIIELAQIFRQLEVRLRSPVDFAVLMRDLGWNWDLSDSYVPDFASFSDLVTTLEGRIVDFVDEPDEIQKLLLLGGLIDGVIDIKNELDSFNSYFENITLPAHLDGKLPEKLLNHLLIEYFKDYHPSFYFFFRLIGLFALKPAEIDGYCYLDEAIDFSKLPDFIANPKSIFEALYKWRSRDFDSQKLLDEIEDIFVVLGIPAGQYLPHPNLAKNLLELAGIPSFAEMGKELRLTIFEASLPDIGYVDAALCVYPIPDKNDMLPGVAIIPYLNGGVGVTLEIGAYTQLKINGDLSSGVAIEVRPGGDTTKSNLLNDTSSGLNSSLTATISHTPNDDRVLIFGEAEGSRLDVKSISYTAGIRVSKNNPADVYCEFHLEDLQFILVVKDKDGDGFLRKLLTDSGINSNFDIIAGYSSASGLYFQGSAVLELTIPVHKTLGPLKVESIYLGITAENRKIDVAIAASVGAQLGPVAVSIEKMGIDLPFGFPQSWGELGPVDFDYPSFKPPLGAGISLDAEGIVGGGYLKCDDDNKRYGGILELQFGEIALTAIGLITTIMPDGSDGFSLLINIGVTFSPPIQLSFGFTLTSVGGLIGINRTMVTDALRDGLRNKTLNSILFPEDPVLNATKIISDMRTVFPPHDERYVVGPMIKLGWGSPNIITADVGVFMELPEPVRIAVLGQIDASLPSRDNVIVELHIDVIGIIDFGKEELSIDATLYDSRIYTYTLSGDAAIRWSWGDNPHLAMSLGGFHPKFSPPPAFPALRRLSLNISKDKSLQIACWTYTALTSNSLQFGAGVELYAKEAGASVEGNLSFDALIYFDPFAFMVNIAGHVVAKYEGHRLMGVRISMSLSGPTPWHARGKATFEILFWDISVDFNETWGSDRQQSLPSVDPWPKLEAALKRNESWGSYLPDALSLTEALRELDEVEIVDKVIVHPAGWVEVRQNVLPFDVTLQKLGNCRVITHNCFWIYKISIAIGSSEVEDLKYQPVEDDFARGQYQDLSDQQRLSLPSFEKMPAGAMASTQAISYPTDSGESFDLCYESILIKDARISEEPKDTTQAKLSWNTAKYQLRQNAAKISGYRNSGNQRYAVSGKASKVSITKEGYYVVRKEDLSPVVFDDGRLANDGTLTRMQADEMLAEYNNMHPDEEVQVISAYEAAA